MKNVFLKSLIVSALAIIVSSCTKPEYGYADVKDNSTEWQALSEINDVMAVSAPQLQSFRFSVTSGKEITAARGTKVSIPPNAFVDASGKVISGVVDFEIKEFFDVGDMIAAGLPTTSGDQYLVSGGEIYISAKQNGNEVHLANGKSLDIMVPTSNADPNMKLFTGSGSVDSSTFDWNPANNPVQTCSDSSSFGLGYCFSIDSLINFINCDYFANYQGQMTEIEIEVPPYHTDSNTVVFLYIPSINSVARIRDYSNGSFWVRNGYKVPVGTKLDFVAIHKSLNGNLYYAYSPGVTIVNNHVENLSFQNVSAAAIQAFLDSL